MTYLDFAALPGTLLFVALALVGARTLWQWLSAGYRLEQRHIQLGQDCLKVADDVLEDVSVPVLKPRVVR